MNKCLPTNTGSSFIMLKKLTQFIEVKKKQVFINSKLRGKELQDTLKDACPQDINSFHCTFSKPKHNPTWRRHRHAL